MTHRIYFFCFVNTAAGHPLWSSQHPSIGTGKCTDLDTSIQSHRSQLSQWKKGWKSTSSCPSLSHIASNRQFQLTSSTLCQLLVKCGSNAGKVSINHGSMFVQIWFKCFSTVGQSCIKSGSSNGQSSENCWPILQQLSGNHASIIRQTWFKNASTVCQLIVNCVSIVVSIVGQSWVNHGSIMGQFWVKYGSIMGQSWINHRLVIDQS